MSDLYTKHQLVALNTFLAYWPDGVAYDEVLKRLDNDEIASNDHDDGIDLAADYEDFEAAHVAQLIDDLRDTLARTYGEG